MLGYISADTLQSIRAWLYERFQSVCTYRRAKNWIDYIWFVTLTRLKSWLKSHYINTMALFVFHSSACILLFCIWMAWWLPADCWKLKGTFFSNICMHKWRNGLTLSSYNRNFIFITLWRQHRIEFSTQVTIQTGWNLLYNQALKHHHYEGFIGSLNS